MATVTIHPCHPRRQLPSEDNPLPQLLQTPTGLAILELQGTFNVPHDSESEDGSSESAPRPVPIGRIEFPDYRRDALDPTSTAWMKRVWMYVGQHQRLLGEVKKLPRPLAVVRTRKGGPAAEHGSGGGDGEAADDLEMVELVKFKLVFSQRPEPVNQS